VDERVRLLLEIFDQAYTAPSWHGTPLKGTLRGLSGRAALWRPGPKRTASGNSSSTPPTGNAWSGAGCCAIPPSAFPREGVNWPALPTHPDNAAWRRDRALLDEEHRILRRVIAALKPADLGRRGWRSRWKVRAEIYGIASHDLYHAGQIQVLKRLIA